MRNGRDEVALGPSLEIVSSVSGMADASLDSGQPSLTIVDLVDSMRHDIQSQQGSIMAARSAVIPSEQIEQAILVIRGQKVMLDSDLAKLYGVENKVLNRAVKRNLDRFPADFMFQLSPEETAALRFQFGTLKLGRGQHRKYLPYAFTEQGVAMLSTVLRSRQAVQVNIEIMRAFVRLRQVLAGNAELAHRLAELERRVGGHDQQFASVIRAIRELMAPPLAPTKRRIGFQAADEGPSATAPKAKRKAAPKVKRNIGPLEN